MRIYDYVSNESIYLGLNAATPLRDTAVSGNWEFHNGADVYTINYLASTDGTQRRLIYLNGTEISAAGYSDRVYVYLKLIAVNDGVCEIEVVSSPSGSGTTIYVQEVVFERNTSGFYEGDWHYNYVDSKARESIEGKQDKLTQGSNITIENNVISADLSSKQDTLVSGENIKTVNGLSILGEGDLAIQSSSEILITQSDYDKLVDKDENAKYEIYREQ